MGTQTPTPTDQNLHPKVVAAGIAGAITAVVTWALKQYCGIELPADVAAALTTLVSFAAGYLKGV